VCSSFVKWPQVSVLEVAAVPAAVGRARRHAKWALGEWGVPGALVADAEDLISELMTNAMQATVLVDPTEPIALRLLANQVRLVIEAWDCHPDEPMPSCMPDGEAVSGRGLAIVNELANRWGTRRLSANVKAVWAELLLPARHPSGEGIAR
jgi:anti-sigma regulatory factor (Ser/Thr protein kinase)